MKLDLAQYREMAAFSQFASDLDASTKQLLNRGAHLTEMLKQPQYHPMSVAEEVVAIYAGVRGYLDKVALGDVRAFEEKALSEIRANHPDFLKEIEDKKVISDELEKKLAAFYEGFLDRFCEAEEAA